MRASDTAGQVVILNGDGIIRAKGLSRKEKAGNRGRSPGGWLVSIFLSSKKGDTASRIPAAVSPLQGTHSQLIQPRAPAGFAASALGFAVPRFQRSREIGPLWIQPLQATSFATKSSLTPTCRSAPLSRAPATAVDSRPAGGARKSRNACALRTAPFHRSARRRARRRGPPADQNPLEVVPAVALRHPDDLLSALHRLPVPEAAGVLDPAHRTCDVQRQRFILRAEPVGKKRVPMARKVPYTSVTSTTTRAPKPIASMWRSPSSILKAG
jgi:hypothetical protein